ncbi:MAG: YihY/virulence factor BrkB family protein [Verrucomicrobiota bacterium]
MFDWFWGNRLKKKAPYFAGFAASIAFFFLLALVPFLIVTISLISHLFNLDMREPMTLILEQVIPPNDLFDASEIVDSASKAGQKGILTATFLLAFWSASNFMNAIVQALHVVFSVKESLIRRDWIHRLYSFALLLVWSAFIMLTSLSLVMAPAVESFIDHILLIPETNWASLRWARYLIILIMMVGAFWTTYRLTAVKHPVPSRFWQGALIASLGWIGVGWLFTYIVPIFWKQNLIYGALGSIVTTFFWAYSSAWVVILGACWIVRTSGKSD